MHCSMILHFLSLHSPRICYLPSCDAFDACSFHPFTTVSASAQWPLTQRHVQSLLSQSYLSKRGEWNIADLLSLQDIRALDRGSPRVLGRPLQGGGHPARHLGLHTTGSVFVTPVDASNCDAFFCSGETAFKCVVLTEHARTPDWLAGFAGEHHTLCDFGEVRLNNSLRRCTQCHHNILSRLEGA